MNQLLNTAPEIILWLEQHKVKNYTIIPDQHYGFIVDVDGNVNLSYRQLKSIDVKFNCINGDFSCDYNGFGFQSLKGCPQSVNGNFTCSNNGLVSLEYCPQHVGTIFNCQDNPLLGTVQEISDFCDIYRIHQEIVKIKREKNSLSDSLIAHQLGNSRSNTYKI